MATLAVLELDQRATHVDGAVLGFDKARGQGGAGAVQAFLQDLEAVHLLAGAGLHVGLRIGMGQGLDTLPGKVAVAEPAVVLVAGVDHQLERLCCDFLDCLMHLGGHLVA